MSQHLRDQWRRTAGLSAGKTSAMVGPIYRGFTVAVSDSAVEAIESKDWSRVHSEVVQKITGLGASRDWHSNQDTTVGLYWSFDKDVAFHFSANPSVKNIVPVVLTAQYDDSAPPGVAVGRSDNDYYVKGGEKEHTLSPGTRISIVKVAIGMPNISRYSPDQRDPDWIVESILSRTWMEFSGDSIQTTATPTSWRPFVDSEPTQLADATILTEYVGTRKVFEVYVHSVAIGNYPTLEAAKAAVAKNYGSLVWRRVTMPKVEVDTFAWGKTDEFTTPQIVYTTDLPRLGKRKVVQ